eukprot:scaffold21949_cov110-Isochrysis_galbana.AAC.2
MAASPASPPPPYLLPGSFCNALLRCLSHHPRALLPLHCRAATSAPPFPPSPSTRTPPTLLWQAALGALYPPLLVYAIGCVAVPIARSFHVRRLNRCAAARAHRASEPAARRVGVGPGLSACGRAPPQAGGGAAHPAWRQIGESTQPTFSPPTPTPPSPAQAGTSGRARAAHAANPPPRDSISSTIHTRSSPLSSRTRPHPLVPVPTSQMHERDIILSSAQPTNAAATPPALDDFDRKLAALDARGGTEANRPRPDDIKGEADVPNST